jgi:hypothetical protein
VTARRTGTASAAALLAVVVAAVGVDAYLGVEDARDDILRHQADAAVIEAQRVRVVREGEASGRVVARLIAGEVSLAAAVGELEPALRERVGFECEWPDDPPPTFRHRVARCIRCRVAADLEHDPARQAAVLARFDVEYAGLR